jgi:hypothetical protein
MDKLLAKIEGHRNSVKKAASENALKRAARKSKKARISKSRKAALPKLKSVTIPKNYLNPLTRSPMKEAILYMLTNRGTGRKNYFTRAEVSKLTGRSLTNYNVLMFDPKKPMFKNPLTRNPVYARDLQRVRAK